jgi:hypothetical protein
MDVKPDDEYNPVTLLSSLLESQDQAVNSIIFSTTETHEFDIIVGDLLFEEV